MQKNESSRWMPTRSVATAMTTGSAALETMLFHRERTFFSLTFCHACSEDSSIMEVPFHFASKRPTGQAQALRRNRRNKLENRPCLGLP